MKSTYMFSHNTTFATHKEIVDYFKSSELIITWRKELPFSYFIVSEADASEICNEMIKTLGNEPGAQFLVAQLNANCQGLLEERSWTIINEQRLPPKPSPSLE